MNEDSTKAVMAILASRELFPCGKNAGQGGIRSSLFSGAKLTSLHHCVSMQG